MQPYYPTVIKVELKTIPGLRRYVLSTSHPPRGRGSTAHLSPALSPVFSPFTRVFITLTPRQEQSDYSWRAARLRVIFSPPQGNLELAAPGREKGECQGGGGTAPTGSTAAALQPGSATPLGAPARREGLWGTRHRGDTREQRGRRGQPCPSPARASLPPRQRPPARPRRTARSGGRASHVTADPRGKGAKGRTTHRSQDTGITWDRGASSSQFDPPPRTYKP